MGFSLNFCMSKIRNYIQARNLLEEARAKLKDFGAIMGWVNKEYDRLRRSGIVCQAFKEEDGKSTVILVTGHCWNHVFKHPKKRQSKVEKLERALCLELAEILLRKTTTYQEVSRVFDKGSREYLYFGIIGYVRGNRIKTIIRKHLNDAGTQYVLYSFYQMTSAPSKNAPRMNS